MGQADELTDQQWQSMRIYPGQRYPELPFFDDDWARFYYRHDKDDIVAWESHEMCEYQRCQFRSEPCPWHPINCDCSLGACRGEFDEEEADRVLKMLAEKAKDL